ncbi:MAG: MFS transporter [Thermomicrobiales bacterium]
MTTIALTDLTPRQQRHGIAALMTSTFFSWAGFFLVIPLMAVHYVDHIGWAAGSVGIVLALRQLTQQGLTTFFGVLCDRVGPKPLIATGMLVRAAGFAAMAVSESFWPVLAAAILAALGGSMFESPKSASLAALSRPDNRQRLFAMLGVISGMGTTIGTQAGALLIRADFAIVCLVGASAYVVIFAVMLLLMPNLNVSGNTGGAAVSLKTPFRDRDFMSYLLILTGYWFCSAQFGLTVTLAATQIAGTDAAISWIYAVNAAIVVGLGYFLPRWLERWLSPLGLLIAGLVVIALGMLCVGVAGNTLALLIAAAVYSLGSVLARPGQETVTANLALPSARGTYFGVASLSLAVGGGLGNYLGGVLFDVGQRGDLALVPWVIFCAIGLIAAVGMQANRHRFGRVRSDPLAEGPVEPVSGELVPAPASAR